jgi:hypothetical protein
VSSRVKLPGIDHILYRPIERGPRDREADKRLAQYDDNEIREKEEPLRHRIFRCFVGPMPIKCEE